MSPSEQIDEYARGWAGLMKQVRAGHSWSGGERNRFFLNGRDGEFHEMSHTAGLDQIEDGRGLAVVDWNQDGRLDLWYRNRSAPRLRLMLNRRETGRSIAIKLEGTSANRDAIGAVVELLPSEKDKLVRSVRAGDLFLSQSSKWLHFGGDGDYHAQVIWPGGERETFPGISSSGSGRFLLKQGTGKAQPLEQRAAVSLKAQALVAGKPDDGRARIVLPSRIPLPAIAFRDQAARAQTLAAGGKPRLLVLWSGTCGHCKRELRAISEDAAAIRAAQLEVLALAVDGIAGAAADTSAAYDLIDATSFPFAWGLIDAESAARLQGLQAALFDRTPASSVPLAILLDENNHAVAIYRGEFAVDEVLQDWQAIRGAGEKELYHLAPPMSGTWFTNPLPQREVVRLLGASER